MANGARIELVRIYMQMHIFSVILYGFFLFFFSNIFIIYDILILNTPKFILHIFKRIIKFFL